MRLKLRPLRKPCLKGFWRDRRGVSAIEFALIAPVLIFMYMGLAELTQAMTAQRRASHVASTIGDLVTQEDSVSAATVDDMLNAGATIMQPYSATPLKIRMTSITADSNGVAKVDWSRSKGGLAQYTKGATFTGLPTGLIAAGENILFAESQYAYTSPVTTVLKNPFSFSEKFYLKARKGSKVACADCT